MEMNKDEFNQSQKAYEWIKRNKKVVLEKFASTELFFSDDRPITVFMAGSPGAGKTEISERFIKVFEQPPVRIDADEIRVICEGYSGENAHIYQKAATKGVQILFDYALHNDINVILDGTFAYGNALDNISRSLKHDRQVEILFVYQNPLQAWDFTKKREALMKRKVTKEVFIDAYFKSRENANLAKQEFGKSIKLTLFIKDFVKDLEQLELNINNIDDYVKKEYSREDLNELLK